MGGVVALVVGFGSSGALAGAYGLAVTGAMMVDATLAMAVAILVWKWRWPVAALVFGLLAIPDIAFFIANALKIPDGGWLPLVVAGVHLLHHHDLAAGPPPGRHRDQRRQRCRCASSSSAWSARPTASPAPRCS